MGNNNNQELTAEFTVFVPDDNSITKMDYSKQELNNVDIPDDIAKEIRRQKEILAVKIFISIISLIIGLFFTFASYFGVVDSSTDTILLIPKNAFRYPGFMIALSIISFISLIYFSINASILLKNIASYKKDILNSKNAIPLFLIKLSKKMIVRHIYANWVYSTIYLLVGMIIGILWAIQASEHQLNPQEFYTPLLVLYILLPIMFFLHVWTLISSKYRKEKWNSYFNTELVTYDEQRQLKKHANKICLITFVIIVTIVVFLIAIPILIIKKRKKSKHSIQTLL